LTVDVGLTRVAFKTVTSENEVKILAALMMMVFCLSSLSLNGDVCPEDSAVLTSFDRNAHATTPSVASTPAEDRSSEPSSHPVHLCHCGHTLQILSVQVLMNLNPKILDPSHRRWLRSDDDIISRSVSPLLRPPIHA
jgi:hypothetical protein